ncbi:MAG: signal peptidase II [Ruminococcaceae bacterium]|nr:signal peptidase II [Oscillospiraceae bacterium]
MIFSLIVVVLSVVLDQLSKYLAVTYLTQIDTFPVIENVLHFTYVENRGAAFGMLSEHRWVFMVLSVVGIGALIVWLAISKVKSRWLQCAIALVVGGGIGNMIDRVRLEYVIDFIDCRFINFYVFNIADSCVCVGCAMVVLAVIIDEVKEKKKRKAEIEKAASGREEANE